MNFSIILASRERVHLLDSLLHSITNTIGDKTNCEVICVIDSDDRNTKRFSDRLHSACPFLRLIIRDRANNLNDDYLNWAWKNYAVGDNIIVVNDDVIFKTMNWDQIIMAHLTRYLSDKPDGIAYGWIQDGLKQRASGLNYCCFPLVTRKAAEVLGFIMPPDFPGWGADIGVYRIYSAINRVCDLSPVTLDHVSYHNGSRTRDHISLSVEQRSIGQSNPINEFDITPYVEKLFKHVGDGSFKNCGTLSGVTLTNVTIVDAVISGGKVQGGKIINGNVIESGRLVDGVLKSGSISGDIQSGRISGFGNVCFED